MNTIRPNTATNHKPNLIILEVNARGRFGGIFGRSDHGNKVEENARLVNPNINVSRKNSRVAYFTPFDSEELSQQERKMSSQEGTFKSGIKSAMRAYLKANYQDLSEIL